MLRIGLNLSLLMRVARKAGDRVNESSKAFILLGFYYIRV